MILVSHACDMGREVVVAAMQGKLDFGTRDQIFYGEFDGRRCKRVLVKLIGGYSSGVPTTYLACGAGRMNGSIRYSYLILQYLKSGLGSCKLAVRF